MGEMESRKMKHEIGLLYKNGTARVLASDRDGKTAQKTQWEQTRLVVSKMERRR